MAPASPGEHGVNKSYSMTDGSFLDGPATCQGKRRKVCFNLSNALGIINFSSIFFSTV